MKRHASGFTLIEILVVVAILGVMMGLVSILVVRSSAHQRDQTTTMLVRTYLPTSIDRYKLEFKQLPPMTMKQLNAISRWKALTYDQANATNECNEVLLVALRHPDISAPLGESDLPVPEPFGNTDHDGFNMVPDGSDSASAREILDAYGNPIVYIDKNHYGETVTIVNAAGDEVEVSALKREDGTWYNKTSYQIISVGDNGHQDLEGGDDIVNFKREGE